MSIAEILHKRPFQTAATLITLCKGQSKGKMMRAVTVDTQCTNGSSQIVEERGGTLGALQAHFGTRTYGKLFDTNHGHHRTAQTIQSHLRPNWHRIIGWCHDCCRFVYCFLPGFIPLKPCLFADNNSYHWWKYLQSLCLNQALLLNCVFKYVLIIYCSNCLEAVLHSVPHTNGLWLLRL